MLHKNPADVSCPFFTDAFTLLLISLRPVTQIGLYLGQSSTWAQSLRLLDARGASSLCDDVGVYVGLQARPLVFLMQYF